MWFIQFNACNYYYRNCFTHKKDKRYVNKNIRLTDEARAGIMNPSFLEFLMGYPIGWTRLSVRKDSES